MSKLMLFIPEEAYALMIVVAGMMLIFGLKKTAGGLLSLVVVFALLGPFIDSLVTGLPSWLFALLLFFVAISLIRMFLGKGVMDHLVAMLLFGLIRFPFRILSWLIRGFVPGRRS